MPHKIEDHPSVKQIPVEKKFELLVSGVRDYAIYMIDTDGTIVSWNTGAQRFKGYLPSEVIGKHFSIFYTEEDQKNHAPEASMKIARETGKFESEGWRVRKDGSKFWASVVMDAIYNEDGDLIGYAKVTRDITEFKEAQEQKKKTEEALKRANAALFQSQKMEAIGQLTGGIAHDFNNLLSVMSSALDVLSTRLTSHEDVKMIKSMQRAVDRGAELTQQLLSFARKQPLKVEKHNVNALIEAFQPVLKRAITSRIKLTVHADASLHGTEIDAARFESSLLNLVVNARDAIPNGGSIQICTKNISLSDHEVGSLPSGEYIVVSVSDDGTGMTKDVASRVFDPFFTTKDVGKGTGLGLSQVYGFVKQSGGDIVLDTAVGKGTTFYMYFPSTGAAAPESVQVEEKIDKILIVEDEADLLDVASELFKKLGYDVITASNGVEAVDVLEKQDGRVDLLFTDVMMPTGMNGIELAHYTRVKYPHIHIIIASGYSLPMLESSYEDIDHFVFVNKPYRLPEIAKKLRESLLQKLQSEEE